MVWTLSKWYLVVSCFSMVVIVGMFAWDWFFWRRLPWLRWKAQQRTQATSLLEPHRNGSSHSSNQGKRPDQSHREIVSDWGTTAVAPWSTAEAPTQFTRS